MLQTRKSNPNKPPRIVIYGPEGVGKSSLGAKSKKPIFITPEGGADQLTDEFGNEVIEAVGIHDWKSYIAYLNALLTFDHEYETLVLDSADWIEKLCHAQIIGKSDKSITTVHGGYGAGFRQSEAMHKEMFDILNMLREKKNMAIIVTAHAQVKPVKDPEMLGDYDSFEIKCHEFVSSLWREWCDALLFARFRAFLNASDDTVRARALSDGSRVVYARKTPSFQAKNRYRMPAEMDFTEDFFSILTTYTKKGAQLDSPEEIILQCNELLVNVKDETLKATIQKYINDNLTNASVLDGARTRLKTITAIKE